MDAFAAIEANRGLIYQQIGRIFRNASSDDRDDLYCDIRLILAEKLPNEYDPSRGMAVASFIGMVAYRHAINVAKSHTARRTDLSDSIDATSNDCTAEDTLISVESQANLARAIRALPESWQSFAMDLLAEDFEPATYAQTHSLTVSNVYAKKSRLLGMLRDLL
jgi:DNA-directed RNA polymerase specialized sigma24 family protein